MNNKKDRDYYKLSEMVKLTGVHRRKFQFLREQEILYPLNIEDIEKAEQKNSINKKAIKNKEKIKVRVHWKYSKEALSDVYIIEMLHELGYTYNKIKKIYKDDSDKHVRIEATLNDAQKKLDQKINDLKNKKNYLDYILRFPQYIDELSEILKKYYFTKFCKKIHNGIFNSFKSFKQEAELFSPLINISEENNISCQTTELGNLLILMLLSMKKEPQESDYVEECLKAIFKVSVDSAMQEAGDDSALEDNDLLIYKYSWSRSNCLLYANYSKFKDLTQSYNNLCDLFGEDSFVFVQEVFDKYSKRIKKEYQDIIASYEIPDEEILNCLYEIYSTNNTR